MSLLELCSDTHQIGRLVNVDLGIGGSADVSATEELVNESNDAEVMVDSTLLSLDHVDLHIAANIEVDICKEQLEALFAIYRHLRS
ncbi:hypothetical protein CTA1_4724 [Colletotrichum tanaceti]|uniref:Uncharacterized protein n=1 Tax=Colletotrichum tanaceti TaxID=1306861 RepID=A0A4U6XW22_9PEZI|nr:hypothetical protein CTA1_4724 [Colletotrichum tanaceti]